MIFTPIQSRIPYEVVTTERSNHCHDLIATADLSKYAAVVIISGDGLLYEYYQVAKLHISFAYNIFLN